MSAAPLEVADKEGDAGKVSIEMPSVKESVESIQEYRQYKRRWIGLVALVILNLVGGMVMVWFGPIANDVADDFGFTLDQINWFGNVVNLVYVPSAIFVPWLYGKFGIRGSCYIGAVVYVISAWIRYAGTVRSLSVNGSLALIMLGQLLAGWAVPIFQVVVPNYSERWFNLKGRTTATMIMGLANPVGNGIGQLVPPLVSTSRQSLLVMAIMFTVAAPAVFLVGERPPTPPTFAASHKHPSMMSLVDAMLGRVPCDRYTYMNVRQRTDFALMVILFGIVVGVVNAFMILTAQQLEPYGYSDDDAGLLGAALLLVGLGAAAITSPLFDRVFTHRLALAVKVTMPAMAACWIALIWEIKPHNISVLYVLMSIIGATSLSLLPIVLELAVEVTRNADGSSAILWLSYVLPTFILPAAFSSSHLLPGIRTNFFALIFVLIEGALRSGPTASPPLNMHRAVIMQAALIAGAAVCAYGIQGKQMRRAQDELRRDQAADVEVHTVSGDRSSSSAVGENENESPGTHEMELRPGVEEV